LLNSPYHRVFINRLLRVVAVHVSVNVGDISGTIRIRSRRDAWIKGFDESSKQSVFQVYSKLICSRARFTFEIHTGMMMIMMMMMMMMLPLMMMMMQMMMMIMLMMMVMMMLIGYA
jgi:hypothetical protein